MTPPDPERILQYYSPEKDAEFAAMSAADRLAWLDEIRLLCARGAAGVFRLPPDVKPPGP